MLAKAKGQILRVAACLQMLFCDEDGPEVPATMQENIPMEIGEKAVLAAQNYVDICCQHVCFLARNKTIEEVVQHYEGLGSKNIIILSCIRICGYIKLRM